MVLGGTLNVLACWWAMRSTIASNAWLVDQEVILDVKCSGFIVKDLTCDSEDLCAKHETLQETPRRALEDLKVPRVKD